MKTTTELFMLFQDSIHEPLFLVIVGVLILTLIGIKTSGLTLSRFKKPGWNLLHSFISFILFSSAIFSLFFFQIPITHQLNIFYLLIAGLLIGIDIIYFTIVTGKSSWISGMLGILFSDAVILIVFGLFALIQFHLIV